MTNISSRVLAAALSAAAIGGATPAIANATSPASGGQTALAAAIAHMRPLIHERVNPLNERNGWAVLEPNAVHLRKLAAQVDTITVPSSQQDAKQAWVAGVRLEAKGDLGIAAGLRAKGKHDAALYRTDVVRARDTLRDANTLVRRAEREVGLHASSPVFFVYCAKDGCPAG